MKNGRSIDPFSHKANVIVGGDRARRGLLGLLEKEGLSLRGDPDLFDRRYAVFSIDDAREVKSAHETRPASEAGKKAFVLTMDGITVEAQNALLKLLEEPAPYAYFYIIVPSAKLLLPTVLSRVAIASLDAAAAKSAPAGDRAADADVAADAAAFLKLAPAKRLDFVKKFVEEISKEKRPKQDAVELLGALERSLRGEKRADLIKNAAALKAVELARGYSVDRAPSIKMLLEYVALSV